MVDLRAAQVVDELITIGERGRMIAIAARKAGLPKMPFWSWKAIRKSFNI